jgi:hypothetical protein
MRYDRRKDLKDVQKGISLQREALDLLPVSHADRAQILAHLAQFYLLPLGPDFSPSKALELAIDAVTDVARHPQLRVAEALDVLSRVQAISLGQCHEDNPRTGSQGSVLKLYQLIIDLLPQVAFFGLDVRSRLRVLRQADNVAVAAAVRALDLKKPQQALEVLDNGRMVFWT